MQEIERLVKGFRRFQAKYFEGDDELYGKLKSGQRPGALVIGCSDSRVDPAIMMRTKPGELFVVRNVANLVPPYEPDKNYHGVSAAIEYAVKSLQVGHIIILGHSTCGGINALMSDSPEGVGEFIGPWVDIARPAREAVLSDMPDAPMEKKCKACEQASILVSIENLLTFPWIKDKVEKNELELHGWYFEIDSGEMWNYDAESGKFERLAE